MRSDVFTRLWRASHTSLRLSLTSQRSSATTNPEDSFVSVGPLAFAEGEIRVQQVWELGPRITVTSGKRARRTFDFAAGAAVRATALGVQAQPVARARLRLPVCGLDAVVRVAPTAEARLTAELPLLDTGLRCRTSLCLPWTNEQFDALALGAAIPWRPLVACRIFTAPDSGALLHFSPRGVTVTERSLVLGGDTVLRAAASLDFPSEWPPVEGNDELRLRVDKLALTTRLRYGRK